MAREDLIGGGTGAPPPETPPEGGTGTPPPATPPEGGGIEIKYPETFPKEFHGNPTIMKHINQETGDINYGNVMSSLIHAQKLVGADKIIKPTDSTSEQEWGELFRKLGNPEKVEDYKIEAQGFNAEDPMSKGFIETAHKAGVLPKQAAALFEYYDKAQKEAITNADALGDEAYNAEVGKLKAAWGDNFEKEAKISEAAFTKLFSPDDQKYYKEAGLLTDPAFIKAMNTVGKKMLDDNTLNAGGGDDFQGNEAQLKASYRESYAVLMKGDKTNPAYVHHQNNLHKLNELAAQRGINLHS